LSTLRQKLKKFNKDFEADIEKYREVGYCPMSLTVKISQVIAIIQVEW
jgi:hypothetical protein